jgi:hypothetical protein
MFLLTVAKIMNTSLSEMILFKTVIKISVSIKIRNWFRDFTSSFWHAGHAVALLVEALRYKPQGRGFDSRWGHWNFSLT